MIDKAKITTMSVRVEEELMKQVDKVTSIIPMNKSDFLRSCLEKLCRDNKMLLDHYDKFPEYIEFIKNELRKLPENMIRITNGSWDNVKESTILIICDLLWQSSEIVFDNWKKLVDKYGLTRERKGEDMSDFSKVKESNGLLALEDIVFVFAEKSGQVERVDLPLLLNETNWIGQVEADMISLSYAVKTAFEDTRARVIIKKFLEKAEEEDQEEHLRLVIDAKGGFRRSGYVLHLPVYTEKMESTG